MGMYDELAGTIENPISDDEAKDLGVTLESNEETEYHREADIEDRRQ